MFLRNSWYVVGWSREIADKPIGRIVLGDPLVLFRGADGQVAALEDRCPHRHVPLSIGKVCGNAIRCGYHGMVFDVSGKCIEVPSQAAIPSRARVRSYPVVERHGWAWAWMGEAEKADADLIPDFSILTDPNYRAVGKTNHVSASYKLLVDNLMDLSHVGFVHQTTIGNPNMAEKGKLTSRRTDRGVQVLRTVPDVPPPPTYIKSGRLPPDRNIDRWQVIDYVAPSSVMIHVGGAEAGTGALEGRYEQGLNLWVMNAITPETETSSHYFWSSVRQHALHSEEADALFFSQVSEAFDEDCEVLEAQQRVLRGRDDTWSVPLKSDKGSIEARRMLNDFIVAEQASLAAPQSMPATGA